MNAHDKKTLRQFVDHPHAVGTLYGVVAALIRVVLALAKKVEDE